MSLKNAPIYISERTYLNGHPFQGITVQSQEYISVVDVTSPENRYLMGNDHFFEVYVFNSQVISVTRMSVLSDRNIFIFFKGDFEWIRHTVN